MNETETTSKFTPPPWVVAHRHVHAKWDSDEMSGLGWGFVEGKGPKEPQLRGQFAKAADAHLIAAAPDLLEALGVAGEVTTALYAYLDSKTTYEALRVFELVDNANQVIFDAIAKARGVTK